LSHARLTNGAGAKLIEHLKPSQDRGRLVGFAATTYETDADFIDRDLLPTLLGVPAWKDESVAARVSVERRLQELDGAEIVFDPAGFHGRPRSLRLDVRPRATREIVHAKVTLLLHEGMVTLIAGSANLTAAGWRRNRECAGVLSATGSRTADIPMIREALVGLRSFLRGAGITVVDAAMSRLDAWMKETISTARESWFLWSGPERSLCETILNAWPDGALVNRVVVCSPFWSDSNRAGPLGRMAAHFSERGLLSPVSSVSLIAQGWSPFMGDSPRFLPRLPRLILGADLRKLGFMSADAAAATTVDPGGPPGRRELHAKVLLIEGPTCALAYFGSANFTVRAFGLAPQANHEAGMMLLRRGAKGRSALRALLPPVDPASRIELHGEVNDLPPGGIEEEMIQPWPHFLLELELDPRPQAGSAGTLAISVAQDDTVGPWHCGIGTGSGIQVLHRAHGAAGDRIVVSLSQGELLQLLIAQQVVVHWAPGYDAEVPLNVVDGAKAYLPMAPERGSPSESDIIAYLTGQLSWPGLFGATDIDDDRTPAASDLDRVDTSGIVAYRMRDFVEALPGMPDVLAAGAGTVGAMRLALLGPASPLSLARHAVNAAQGASEPKRSVTTAAFQVIELISTIEKTRRPMALPAPLVEAWESVVDEAQTALAAELEKLRRMEPAAFARGTALARLEAAIRPSARTKRTKAA